MVTTRTLRLTALAAAAALALASCSSSGDAPASSTAASGSTVAASSGAASPTTSGSAVAGSPTSAAGLACAAYFQLDLLNSKYAGGAVANGNMTEQQVKTDFNRLLGDMVTQAKLAGADGTADSMLLVNAERMKKMIKSLKKKQILSNLSTADQAKFAKQSLRVQRSCDRAGYPLPADNVTARTSAGLS